jgi:hypothetical protein
MPPLNSFAKHVDNAGYEQNYLSLDSGFTTPLLVSISKSKSKMQKWVEHEKSKIDSRAETYRENLNEYETRTNMQSEELLMVQRECGIQNGVFEDKNGTSDSNDNIDHPQNIASQKKALEEHAKQVQIEIMKLKSEQENREKRVHDIEEEESKQQIRANDATALKRAAEESKNTTIDDLTRGVVNYKKLGLDFAQTGRDAELRLNFTEIDPVDSSRIFSFVLLVNDEEKYDVIKCDPKIDPLELAKILCELNESGGEDISILARRMRRAFRELCICK